MLMLTAPSSSVRADSSFPGGTPTVTGSNRAIAFATAAKAAWPGPAEAFQVSGRVGHSIQVLLGNGRTNARDPMMSPSYFSVQVDRELWLPPPYKLNACALWDGQNHVPLLHQKARERERGEGEQRRHMIIFPHDATLETHVPDKRRHYSNRLQLQFRVVMSWVGVHKQPYLSWASHSAGMWKPSSRGFERWVLMLLLAAGLRAAFELSFEFVVEFIVEFIVRRVRADASRNLRANAVVFKSDFAFHSSREAEGAKQDFSKACFFVACFRILEEPRFRRASFP